MGILEKLKNAGRTKSPAELIAELDSELASTAATLPGLDAERADALLLGNLDAVHSIESRITATRERLERLRERRPLLEAAAAELEAEQESQRLADVRTHAERVAALGSQLLADYEAQARSLAATLRAWIAVDVEVCRANGHLMAAGQRPAQRPRIALRPNDPQDLAEVVRLPPVRAGLAPLWDADCQFFAERDAAQIVASLLATPATTAKSKR